MPADGSCPSLSEWFIPGTEPKFRNDRPPDVQPVYLQHPTPGLQLAMDPRIPEDQQAFVFRLANLPDDTPVDWFVDDKLVASTSTGEYLWALQRGIHSVSARIRTAESGQYKETSGVSFTVK